MSWREEFRAGSFRGVPFKWADASSEFGRRQAVSEYPQRDQPFVEDLGRRARTFSLDVFVLGDDYRARRDALINAAETAGPGILVHPTRGQISVCCLGCRVRESTDDGGIAYFSLEFVEAGGIAPTVTEDTAASAAASAQAAKESAISVFARRWSLAGQPGFVQVAGESLVASAIDQIAAAGDRMNAAGDALFTVTRKIATTRAGIASLVRSPLSLASAISGLVAEVASLVEDPLAALSPLLTLLPWGRNQPPVIGMTPARLAQAGNQLALSRLVATVAASEITLAVTDVSLASYQEAVALRDRLQDAFDAVATEAADAGDDEVWRIVETLRVAVVRDITARGGSLARLYAYTPAATEPALVIAYRLHGDAARAAEIVARNGVRHPSFVPGGQALEVLTDG